MANVIIDNTTIWAEEIAQFIKAFDTKADDLNLIPRHHMVEKRKKLLIVILSFPHMNPVTVPPLHMNTHT